MKRRYFGHKLKKKNQLCEKHLKDLIVDEEVYI